MRAGGFKLGILSWIEKKRLWFWILIIAAMCFVHIYRIGEIPYGINVDEMGMGYDAWCLANFGTDRYLNSFPLYLINFSGGQSALYAYLCAPFVYFWGISSVTLRIPAIIFSFVTLCFTVKLSNLLWRSKSIDLLVGGLYTIIPVFTMLSRIGLDCNLMLGISTVFLYYLIKAVSEMRYKYFMAAGTIGGVMLYSYVLSHTVLPIFLVFSMIYMLVVRRFDIKKLAVMAVPMFVLAVPLILFHLINIFELGTIKIGIFTIPQLYNYRSGDLSFADLKQNITVFWRNTLLYDSVRFNSIKKYGNIYMVSIPFLIVGLLHGIYITIKSLKHREMSKFAFVVMWMISVYLTAIFLGSGGPTVYRVNSVFICYLLFIVNGILVIFRFIKNYKMALAKVYLVALCCIYICMFVGFSKYYFCNYTDDTYLIDLFNFTFDDVLNYMENELPDGVAERTTYIGGGNQTYIFYLGGELISPYDYNKLVDDKPYTLWLWTQSYKNYRFDFPEEIDPTGNYIVPETSDEYVQLYEKYGFEKIHIGTHYLFWNSMLSYEASDATAVISWDHGLDDDGMMTIDESDNTVLSGWAINSQYGKIWDDIIVEVDGVYYVADKMERQDVADIMGSDIFLNCGFHVTIDTQLVDVADKIRFICIDYDDRACYVQTINIK
jgi:hypothetical protein